MASSIQGDTSGCSLGLVDINTKIEFQYMLLIQGGAGVCGLGLVDLDLGHSTTCPVVLGQMGVWLNRLCHWATWWNI